MIRRTQFTKALVDLMDPPQKPAESLVILKTLLPLRLFLLSLFLYKFTRISSHAYLLEARQLWQTDAGGEILRRFLTKAELLLMLLLYLLA